MSSPPRPDPSSKHAPLAGIVFRPLNGAFECALAGRLLAADEVQPPPATAGVCAWFGLWDLAAAGGDSLVGTAVTGPVGQATVQLYAVAVQARQRRRGFGSRVVREVADTLRAHGCTLLVVAPPTGDISVWRLLLALGFTPIQPVDQDRGPGWLGLEL